MSGGDDSGGDNSIPETAQERAQAEVAAEKWNDYQRRFVPLENRLFGEVRTSTGEMDQAQGFANAASEQSFADTRDEVRRGLFASGARPGSGRAMSAMGEVAGNEALSSGMNMADTGQAMADQEVAGLTGLVAMGRGQSANVDAMFADQAGQAQSQAISDARQSMEDQLSRLRTEQAIGSVAGAATAYGMPQTGGDSGSGIDAASAVDRGQLQTQDYGISRDRLQRQNYGIGA